jgi:hypothetical protein
LLPTAIERAIGNALPLQENPERIDIGTPLAQTCAPIVGFA